LNPQKMLKQFQQAQDRIQQEITAMQVEATAGGGMVKVTLDGHKNLKSLVIDKQVVVADDVEMLQDMIMAAIAEGTRKVDAQVQEKIGSLSAGLPKIPGLF
jgi:DNA-binding YbaB/EbfC family protein